MWNQLNKRGAPLTSGRSSSQKRLARIQYHNEMARRQYIAYQEELKDKEQRRAEKERKRHADRCKKLNLPTSATSDECRDLENKLEQINLEKKRLENEIIMRKKMKEKRLEEERLEKDRLEKERLEEERLENERLEKERLEKIRLEKERLEKERLEKERLEFEILKQKEINQLKLELENVKAEAEKSRLERLEREKVERVRKEKVRLEKIRLEKVRLEKIRLEKERLEKERLEKIRLEEVMVEREQKNRKFNILIRNTYRPNMFKECIESVQEQTHIIPILGNNVRIICCYDDKRSSKYLKKYKTMFKNINLLEIVPNKSNTLQEYNLYCNNLMDKVKDGWILFLNDDNKFLNKHTLSNISKNIDNEDDIIFWSIPLGDAKKNNVYAKMLKNIDMNTGKQMTCDAWKTGFCVHSKHIHKARATAGHDGLDNFLANLLKKNKFNKKFLDQIVVHPVYNKRLFGLREEDYDLHALIRERCIKQCYISEKIAHLKSIIQTNYKITDYDNRDSPCIFFGLYDDNDISIIRNHIHGEKYIVPMGIRYLYDDTKSEKGWGENHNSDFDNYKKTLTVNPLFLSISDKMTDLFKYNKEYSVRIHFDCVDKMLFKPTSRLGTKIFIFNGKTPNLRNASIYGKKYIDQVVKHFPNTEIIWSSMTNVPYHKLSEIYNQVAIGLCLTEQKHEVAGLKEMNFMNIPIIHNHSIFGLKWKNVDDIMNIIKKKINLIHEVCPISQIRHKKILINSHSYLNDNAGDTIMVSNYMNLLMRDNNHITLITKYKCPDFIRNLIYKKYTIVITGDDTKNIMNAIDRYMYSVDYALIRNHEVLEEMKSKPYLNRVIFYGLDCHMDGLKKMNNKFHYIITQSELLKKKLVKNNIDSEKIYIVQPIAFKYDFNLPKKNDNEIRLVYCGTLRDEENILEIIEEFQKIHKKRPEVVLKIVYGKIHGDVTFTRKVNEYIKNGVKGITFKHNLSHKDACYEIATGDIGICWRKNGWGDNGEVSTKVREYKMYGLKIINNINLMKNIKDYQKKINIKFGEKYTPIEKNLLTNIEYDFTYKIITSNTLTKIYLFKNVFYKIICENRHYVTLYDENNLKDNIFRNCLHGKKNTYFNVKNNGLYYIRINTKNKNEIINIENYISLNYICGDNVFMLNLNHQKDKFTINEMILNKMGIMVNRFEAINGYDKKYDELWNKILNTPFNNLEKKLGRKLIVSRGSMGYLLSMEKIFSNIKNSYLCVFDDDILISKDLSIEKLTEILVNYSDFNILKFGSSQWNFDNVKILKNFYYPNDFSNGSFACMYKSTTYKDILQKIRNFNEPFDFSPLRQFNNNKLYIIYPNIIIANLSDVSTITNKVRNSDYERFKWDLNNYIKLPYISNKKSLINNNNSNKNLHFIIGIITFKRVTYLKNLINLMIKTLSSDYFFTIIISKGLDLLESEHVELEEFLINSFKKFDNINLIINYSYLHYNYHTCNSILKLSENIEYDFGFILNDDILVYDDWYIKYYNCSKKNNIEHLCWLQDKKTTIIDENKNFKHNGSVFNANGVLLTFTKNLIKNVGFFNETDFKVRGQSHIEWSLRCCNKGYNNKTTFYDILDSNQLVKLNTKNYSSAISHTPYFDKVIHFVDKYELEKRNRLLNKIYNK
tara:strand:+ start:839 stop:5740 length:4902 start_codon:yes stop_codon:yes gene_type:complete